MYLLLDIGGTKTRIGVSSNLKELDSYKIIPTEQNFEEGIDSIVQTALKITQGKTIQGCAVGIREVLDDKKERLINPPSTSFFPDWVEKPIKQILKQDLKITEIFLENDASMAALGEATWGVGVGKTIVVYITLSTGVGGARVIEGKLDKAIVCEPGDQIINFLGEVTYLTDMVSGKSISQRFGKTAAEINDPIFWVKTSKMLAVGLNNIIVLWSPDVIILGGGISQKINIQDLEEETKLLLRKYPRMPKILRSKLGDLSGLYGAMEYLKQNL